MDTLAIATLSTSIPVVIIFGLIALWITKTKLSKKEVDTEFFLSARNSQSTSRLTWSFFAASVGSWVLFAPAAFITDPGYGSGWIGLICYSFYTGFAVIVVSWAGSYVRNRHPESLSIGHFSAKRYGRFMEIYVSLLVLLNVSIGMF
jgi:hypothetical protein